MKLSFYIRNPNNQSTNFYNILNALQALFLCWTIAVALNILPQ
jgi:hypothetical protein